MAVVDEDDEVGNVATHFRTVPIGHFEVEASVLHIGANPGVRLDDVAELAFPAAVENDVVHVASIGAGFPAIGSRGREANVTGGTFRVVRIQNHLNGFLPFERAGDAGLNALAGHVGERLVLELRGVCAAFADQARLDPLPRDLLELAEQGESRLTVLITEPRHDEVRGQFVDDL